MRAITQRAYGAADVLELRDIDPPDIADDEVLIRVHAAGVDRGVWHLMTGLPYLGRLAFGVRRPKTPVPGMDLAGVVEAVGDRVTRFQPGVEVFGIGKGPTPTMRGKEGSGSAARARMSFAAVGRRGSGVAARRGGGCRRGTAGCGLVLPPSPIR